MARLASCSLLGEVGLAVFALFVATRHLVLARVDQEALTDGAGLASGLVPERKVTLGIAVAGIKSAATFRALFNDLAFATLRTFHTGLLFDLLNVLAVWVAGAA